MFVHNWFVSLLVVINLRCKVSVIGRMPFIGRRRAWSFKWSSLFRLPRLAVSAVFAGCCGRTAGRGFIFAKIRIKSKEACFFVNIFSFCRFDSVVLYYDLCSFALQKAANRALKGRLLQAERRPFARRGVSVWLSTCYGTCSGFNLSLLLLVGIISYLCRE